MANAFKALGGLFSAGGDIAMKYGQHQKDLAEEEEKKKKEEAQKRLAMLYSSGAPKEELKTAYAEAYPGSAGEDVRSMLLEKEEPKFQVPEVALQQYGLKPEQVQGVKSKADFDMLVKGMEYKQKERIGKEKVEGATATKDAKQTLNIYEKSEKDVSSFKDKYQKFEQTKSKIDRGFNDPNFLNNSSLMTTLIKEVDAETGALTEGDFERRISPNLRNQFLKVKQFVLSDGKSAFDPVAFAQLKKPLEDFVNSKQKQVADDAVVLMKNAINKAKITGTDLSAITGAFDYVTEKTGVKIDPKTGDIIKPEVETSGDYARAVQAIGASTKLTPEEKVKATAQIKALELAKSPLPNNIKKQIGL